MSSLPLSGGINSAPNRAPASKVIAGALANNRVAQALIGALGQYSVASAYVAGGSDTTSTVMPNAKVGDIAVMVPDSANASSTPVQFAVVVTAGVSPIAVTSGNLYVDMSLVNLDANNPVLPVGGALTGRVTGDGGLEF